MTVTLSDENKKEILKNYTISDCENIIKNFMDDIERVKKVDPDDFFDIEVKRRTGIDYYKQAIEFLQENDKSESSNDQEKSDNRNQRNIKFKLSSEDMNSILKIILRVCDVVATSDFPNISPDRLARFVKKLHIDIMFCHSNGCQLDLEKLLHSDSENFYQDLSGIFENIDRETGQLKNGFRPQCSI